MHLNAWPNFWDPCVFISSLASRELEASLLFKMALGAPRFLEEKTFSFTFPGFVQVAMPPASLFDIF